MKIKVSELYFFRYNNPKGLGKLIAFDKAPLLCPIGVKDGYLLGVNLHWIVKTERKKFWKFVLLRWEKHAKGKSEAVMRKFPLVLYEEMKRLKTFKHGLVAIRKYIISRITKLMEVPETEYPNIFTPKYKARKVYLKDDYKGQVRDKARTAPKDIKKGTKNIIYKKQQKK